MELKNLSKVRRLALLTVAGNLVATAIAALVLPRELAGIVPVVGLMLPLLSTAVLEGAAERQLGDLNHLPA
jgi:hypothetical protein